MKPTSLSLHASVFALLGAAVFAVTTLAQTPAPPQGPAGAPPPEAAHSHPAPTNLKVLPKDLTGEQVHETMEKWAGELGVHCNTCHAADPKNIGPNGRPRLNFPDDSKPEKATARQMYTMMQGINRDYVMKIENADTPVSCGTCHRGHFDPQPYVIPPEEPNGPRPPQGAPAGAAPAPPK